MSELMLIKQVREARIQIFQSKSLKKLKNFIQKELPHLCQVDQISIQNQKLSSNRKSSLFVFNYPLSSTSNHYMIFKQSKPFDAYKRSLIKSVAKTIDSSLQRMNTYKQLQAFKKQWKSAFNAIEKPICLSDGEFNILSTNEFFIKKTNKSKSDLYKKNCFEVFFGSDLSEKERKTLMNSKILKSVENKNQIYEIHLQSFLKDKNEGTIQLIILTDMTQKIEMEKEMTRLKESVQMGIITSSIAHELTNPLSGIQSLLQISQSEIKEEQVQEGIEQMLEAVQRCQEIISQLLRSDSPPDLLKVSHLFEDKSLELNF